MCAIARLVRCVRCVPRRRQRVGAARGARRGWTTTATIVFVVRAPPGARKAGPRRPRAAARGAPPGGSGRRVVQICCKGPDRVRAPDENRWYSALLLAADPGPERLCNRFGQVPAPDRPRSPMRPTATATGPPSWRRRAPGAPRAPSRPHSTRTVGEDNPSRTSSSGTTAVPGDSPGGIASATPLSLYFALPPSATPLFLVQRRAKGCGAGGERYAPATFLSRRADRRRPRTDRRDRPGRKDAGVAGRPGHEGTRARTDDLVIPAPGP